MIGKKINQLATELAPDSTDLTIIGDPISGVSKKITLAQLGAIFSGAVAFYTNLAAFPVTGDINVIFCAKDTQKLYLWSGSAYVEVFPSQALLNTYQLRSEKGVSNGYASLDSAGKVPIAQLPSSIMEYKGTWNAATNTPTLANGTGDTGDVYICNVAGTVNFGAGPLTFAIGDYVIYSGTIWQRSSGAVGTVTSVAASITGNSIGITGSPVTTSGTLALAFGGTSLQYINGAGNLINFPTSLVTGTGTLYALTKWGFTTGNIINSNLSDTGTTIYNNNPTSGFFAVQFNGNTTTGLSYGLLINAGTNASDIALRVQNASSTSEYFFVYGDGKVQINNIPNATIDTDRFIVSDSGVIKYRTGAELLSDIGGASASGYVPYTGATTNVNLGTHTLSAYNLIINHTSGSGVAASITKGGSGEALTVVKSSGSGNAASITGGVTLLSELHLTTDLADAYIASAANWNDAYNLRHNAVTIGTANGLSLSTQVLSLALASGSTTGALSSTDWTTFNNKQNALTNPVTGTGTINYLPKFTGASTIGNSLIFDDGTNVGIGTASPAHTLDVSGTGRFSGDVSVVKSSDASFIVNNTSASGKSYRLVSKDDGKFYIQNTGVADLFNIASTGAATFSSSATATALIPSGATVPTNGMYLSAANTLNFATNTTNRLSISSAGAATFSSTITAATLSTIGTAVAAQNVQLNLNGVSGKAQRIEFQNNGVQQWLIGAGAASETSAFEIFNSNGTVVYSVNKTTNAATFTGAATFSSTVAMQGLTATTGNFTGALTGTSATFSGDVAISKTGTYSQLQLIDNTASGSTWVTLSGFPALGDYTIREAGVANHLIIKKTTGAATFSSSVTAGHLTTVSPGGGVNSATFRDRTNAVGVEVNEFGALIGYSGIISNNGEFGNNSSGTPLIFKAGATEQFRISSTDMAIIGSIKTGAPTNGTAQPWKLGNANSGTISPNSYIIVSVNGTTYSIPALNGLP